VDLGKCAYLFAHYLNNEMVKNLNEFEAFVLEATKMVIIKINKGDNNRLDAILEAMLLMRSNQPKCDILFDPLKEKVALLKQYGVTDTMFSRIENGPERWLELTN
jgi:protein-arginine kinase